MCFALVLMVGKLFRPFSDVQLFRFQINQDEETLFVTLSQSVDD